MNTAVRYWVVMVSLLGGIVSGGPERSELTGYEAIDSVRAWIDGRYPGIVDAMELVDPPDGKPWVGLGFGEVRNRLIKLKEEFDSEERFLCIWIDSTDDGNQVLNTSFYQSCMNGTAVARQSLYFYFNHDSIVAKSYGGGGIDYGYCLADVRKSDSCKTIEQIASDNADDRASEL